MDVVVPDSAAWTAARAVALRVAQLQGLSDTEIRTFLESFKHMR